jgi:hypothetical protein
MEENPVVRSRSGLKMSAVVTGSPSMERSADKRKYSLNRTQSDLRPEILPSAGSEAVPKSISLDDLASSPRGEDRGGAEKKCALM